MGSKALDIAGQRFGKLVASERMGKRFNSYLWKCICDCGNEHITSIATLRRGDCTNCGCYKKERAAYINRKPGEEAAKNRVFNSIKNGAKHRGIVFELIFEEVMVLIEKNCYYCGVKPSTSSKGLNKHGHTQIMWNGIDRIDNNLGYTLENTRTSCKQCNYAKYKQTETEFMIYINRLVKFYGPKISTFK